MVFNTEPLSWTQLCWRLYPMKPRAPTGTRLPRTSGRPSTSESTLYPVLRRLQKDGCLETYDMEFGGRNRRYYRITEAGTAQLNLYRNEWTIYSIRISNLFAGSEET